MGTEVYFILLSILIPIYFLSKRFFKRRILNKNWRRFAIWITALLLTPLVYVVIIAIWVSFLFYEPRRSFNREIWIKSEVNRYDMADNLVKSKILIGKDSLQVKNIIGFPSDRIDSSNLWIYGMGLGGGGLGFSYHFLNVEFKNGKVNSVFHQRTKD